jgi:hypothetical protein
MKQVFISWPVPLQNSSLAGVSNRYLHVQCRWNFKLSKLYFNMARRKPLLRHLLTVRLLMHPLTIHRLRIVFVVLNGCCLASLLKSLSSLGVIFRDLPVLWRSFTLPVWFARCFNRTMTEWLTLNRSAFCLGRTTKQVFISSPVPLQNSSLAGVSNRYLHVQCSWNFKRSRKLYFNNICLCIRQFMYSNRKKARCKK